MKTILITGSSGFVGSFLKKKLVKKYKVFGIDIVNDNFKDKNYMFFKYDISKEDFLKKLRKKKIDYIIHLSAISTDKIFKKNPYTSYKANINSVINLLNLASQTNVENFIFASSEWVYGNTNMNKKLYEQFPIDRAKNNSGYGISKLIGEDLIVNFYNNKIIKSYVILRFGIVFGPRVSPLGAVEGLLSEVKKDKKIFIFGSEKSARKYIYINDLIDGIEKVILKKNIGTFNLSHSKLHSMKSIVETANKIFNVNKKIIIQKKSKPVIRNVENLKFKKTFKWKPKYHLKNALIDIISKVNYL
jgi:nucleoside-diphosphate-sugar epimerase